MKVTIVGTGYVGLVTGACLAELGHQVLCLDADAAKVALLERGGMPIYEPGLEEIVQRNREEARLRFTSDARTAVAFGDVLFIAVGTPPQEDGSADLRHVHEVARTIGRHLRGFKVVVQKSTVPVGTADQVARLIEAELRARGADEEFAVVSNPEFLKEGAAVEDFMRPDRIVIGVNADEAGQRALARMRQLYAPFNRNQERTRVMDIRSAELTKYAANAMLATRISFMNELANLADRLGADIELVRQGMGSDPRIGFAFLNAGTGYGGSCFPKDVEALCRTAHAHGQRLQVLEAVQTANAAQKRVLLEKVFERFGRDLHGRTFAVWGLAFKPDTDDMREAPSRTLVAGLLRAGARIVAHDPVAAPQAERAFAEDLRAEPELRQRLRFASKPIDALDDADALLLVTEWRCYRTFNPAQVKQRMRDPVIFDGRNLYEPQALAAAGIACIGIGRGNQPWVASAPKAAEKAARRRKPVNGDAQHAALALSAAGIVPAG